MKNDLGDTAEALVSDRKFLADMEKTCATKTAEWEVIVKTRNEELLALSETIKVRSTQPDFTPTVTVRGQG